MSVKYEYLFNNLAKNAINFCNWVRLIYRKRFFFIRTSLNQKEIEQFYFQLDETTSCMKQFHLKQRILKNIGKSVNKMETEKRVPV